MIRNRQKIILDCERMKYPNTGLYHYCLQLGKALQAALINNNQQDLYYFASAQAVKLLNKSSNFVTPKFWHKWVMPFVKKYNIWHATHQSTDYFPKHSKLKIVLTVHDLNFLYDLNKKPQKQQLYLQNLQQKINQADHIVAISQYVKKDILHYCNVANKAISVIYNGCNIDDTIVAQKPENVQPQPFLYTIGTIAEKKNFHVLPALLVNTNYQLIISGITQNQWYKNKIIEEARRLGVAERVVFTDAISEAEKYWYYQNCTAFVFPSLAEGFGLPVIEAMHFGKLVILSTHTSLPEVGGPHAYYFQNFEPANMQQTLIDSLAHYRQQHPQDAIQNWANQFTWQAAAKQYLTIYRSF